MAIFTNIKAVASAIKAVSKAISGIMGWFRDRRLIKAGRDAEKAETQEKVIENVEKANNAVGGLRDTSNRGRVRKKFSRD